MSANFTFRRSRPSGPVLSRQESARQGSAVRSAAAALRDHEAVRLFLNSYHPELSGRPLDLAVASDAGLVAVEAALAAEAGQIRQAGAGS
ncbi:MAG TPA: hypothetical protein VFO69_01940 [Allosphingosinicella sp.]|nr:hypothetical protein [Allosphingosinicella sp.]